MKKNSSPFGRVAFQLLLLLPLVPIALATQAANIKADRNQAYLATVGSELEQLKIDLLRVQLEARPPLAQIQSSSSEKASPDGILESIGIYPNCVSSTPSTTQKGLEAREL
ncbi:MAG: hypothetical protein ACFBSE_11680 [Prochloraceae cyanobacterium]